jgi:hypothetical protein
MDLQVYKTKGSEIEIVDENRMLTAFVVVNRPWWYVLTRSILSIRVIMIMMISASIDSDPAFTKRL